MNPDRWKRVDELFHSAIERPENERLAWLEGACGADTAMFNEVSALLSSDVAAEGGFVHSRVAGAILDFHEVQAATSRRRRVGPYELVREQGRGGMGTVYLAERADDQYSAKVAIKLVRPGMDTDFFLSRFRRERRTLARLQHPNIARLLDSGTTDDGLPYIVMELIDGKHITEYCRENHLSLEQILMLFLPICAAVAHAHQNFVVHRDLKPGNILVDDTGTPKLLDFGICKLLFATAAEGGTMVEGTQMMSPDYASPEQVRALPITVASDIYSLAAVLYGLLTGKKAHRIDKYTPQAVERAICEENIRRPSAVVEDRKLSRRLSGDLDNILLRALQKDPERRYASVEQFAEDLRRHLENLPVSARPDTIGYRARKFVRRNRGALAAGVAIGLALSGGAIGATYEAFLAKRHSTDARQLANTMVFKIYDLIRNLPGSLDARETIVRLGINYFDRLSASAANDSGFRREIAAAYERMGEVQGNVLESFTGDTKGALVSFNKALALLQPLPDSREVELDRVLLLRRIGDVQAYTSSGKEAGQSYEEALRRATTLHQRYPADDNVRENLAETYVAIARIQRLAEDRQKAMLNISEALRLYREGLAAHPEIRSLRAGVASTESSLGTIRARLNQLKEARDNFQESIAAWNELSRLDPTNTSYQREQMLAYSHLGEVLGYPPFPNLGDRAGARMAFQSMLAIAQKLRQADPSDLAGIIDLGMSLMRVAAMSEQNSEKLSLYRQSETLLGEAARANPAHSANQVNLASVQEEIGDTLVAMGDREGARLSYRRSLATAEAQLTSALLSAQRIAVTTARKLAEEAARRGNRQEAFAYAQKALDVGGSAFEKNDAPAPQRSLAPMAYYAMGSVHLLLQERDEALRWLDRSLNAWRALQGLPDFTSVHVQEMQSVEAAMKRLEK